MLDYSKGLYNREVFVKMQMQNDKTMTELDNFLIRNNQQPTPRRSYLSAQPPKHSQLPFKHQHTKENQPLINNTSRSPARSTSKRNLSSHDSEQCSLNLSRQRARSRRSIKAIKRPCENHDEIQGAYKINIEGDDLYYCQKCANKLRSQGFPVKLEQVNSKSSRSRIEGSQCSTVLSSYNHFEGHPQFQALRILLNNIYDSELNLKKATTNKVNIEEVYQQTSDSFEEYMDKIEQIIKFHRLEGRKMFKKTIFDLQKQPGNCEDLIEESLKEIQAMKNDIEGNIESIVQDVDESTFEQCFQSYRERIEELNHISTLNLEEVKKEFQNIKNDTFKAFKNDLDIALSQIKPSSRKEEDESLLCNEGFSNQTNQIQNRGAFRNIFEQNRIVPRKRGISKK